MKYLRFLADFTKLYDSSKKNALKMNFKSCYTHRGFDTKNGIWGNESL